MRTLERPSMMILLLGLGAAMAACGTPDLPEGWQDAAAADEFVADEIGQTDYEDPEVGAVYISGNLDRLEVRYHASFPCTEDLEGFQRIDGQDVDLLVQPTDLHPDAVAGSDCTFDVDLTVLGLDDGTYHVRVYRRDNELVDEDLEAVLVGEGDAVMGFAE